MHILESCKTLHYTSSKTAVSLNSDGRLDNQAGFICKHDIIRAYLEFGVQAYEDAGDHEGEIYCSSAARLCL
jgi:hypothetical protein